MNVSSASIVGPLPISTRDVRRAMPAAIQWPPRQWASGAFRPEVLRNCRVALAASRVLLLSRIMLGPAQRCSTPRAVPAGDVGARRDQQLDRLERPRRHGMME